MKKKFTLILLLLTSFSFSQIKYEKGYFIDNNDNKINCFIKNVDWKNNPNEFEYRLNEGSDINKAIISNVKEFSINGISKYVRRKVKIDRSSNKVGKLSNEKNPIFKEEVLFLKALVEGKATLFSYKDGDLIRFFYKTDKEIVQLIYKNYLTNGKKVGENNGYKQQLILNLKCNKLNKNDYSNLKYKTKNLIELFTIYNNCSDSKITTFNKKEKHQFNLYIKPGLNFSSLSIKNQSNNFEYNYNNESNIKVGLELEYILPFNNKKWSIFTEPTYQYYKSEKVFNIPSGVGGDNFIEVNSSVDYKSIEVPIGLRHYFFLNPNSKLFINTALSLDIALNSKVNFDLLLPSLDIKSRPNLLFGLGYNLSDKYSLEIRYFTDREILSDYITINSNYSSFSIIFGYNLF